MRLEIPPGNFAGHIFDCDGTVVDSMPLHYRAFVAALEAEGAPFSFTKPMFYSFAGMGEVDVTRALNLRFGCSLHPESVLRRKQSWLLQNLDGLASIPAIEAIIRDVARKGQPMAIASGSEQRIVEPQLEAIGLRSFFEVIVTQELVQRGKPAPDLFLLAAEKMGVPAERCLVYEDGWSGVQAAREAGMACVFVPSGPELILP